MQKVNDMEKANNIETGKTETTKQQVKTTVRKTVSTTMNTRQVFKGWYFVKTY